MTPKIKYLWNLNLREKKDKDHFEEKEAEAHIFIKKQKIEDAKRRKLEEEKLLRIQQGLPEFEDNQTPPGEVMRFEDPDIQKLRSLRATYICECPVIKRAIFYYNNEMRLVEIDGEIRDLDKRLTVD